MAESDLESKFDELCRWLLSKNQQDAALAATWRLDRLTDFSGDLWRFVV